MRHALAALTLLASTALAAPSPTVDDAVRDSLEHYNLPASTHLAIEGYDPVSYFPEGGGAPKEGSKELETVHAGVRYRFATEEHRTLFLRTPERYEPAFGGWCAYAMAKQDKVEVDPESYRIQEGRLLLFYDGLFANTRKKWGKEGPLELMKRADAAWKEFSGETRPRSLAHWNLEAGLALGGYDPVAYRSGEALPGTLDWTLVYAGVTYRFASEENRAAFAAAPESYESAYGGWCAWAMAQGEKVRVDPRAFAVEDGRLYLFYDASKRDAWAAERAGFVERADAAWRRVNAE